MQCCYLFAENWFGDRSLNQYFLGDMIYVEAAVSQHAHVPLRVYVDSCEATLYGSNQGETYKLIDYTG